jgi:histidine triad (HIT) family protein
MDDCIFCRIIARQAPAYVIHEDDRVIVFLSLEGHPLVVPKGHIPDIYTLDDDAAAAVMQTAVRVARAVRGGLRCDGVYLAQANETAAGQDVFHFHLHVYPRWHGDRLRFIGLPGQADPMAMSRVREQIRAALHAAG